MNENNHVSKVLKIRIPWYHRFSTRTLIFLVFPSILPLLLVCGVIIYYVGEDAQQDAESALLEDVTGISRKVEYYFSQLVDDINFVATHLEHQNLASPENTSLVAAFAVTHHDIQTVWVTDKSGENLVLYSRQEMLTKKQSTLVIPSVSVRDSMNVTWYGTRYNDFGDPLLTCSIPIGHPWEIQSYGSLYFELQPQYLQQLASEIKVGKTGQAFLVDKNGKIISHSGTSITFAKREMSSHPAMQWLQKADAKHPSSSLGRYQTDIVAFRKIPLTQWGVVVQQNESEAYQMRNRLIWLVSGSFFALILLIIPLVLSFSLRLTRPISALLAAFKKLATGELASESNLSAPGEFGVLASAFSEMAKQRLQSEKRYREIVDDTNNLITRMDGEGRLLFVNHVGEKIFGISLDQLIGMDTFQFIHPDDRERTEKWFATCIEKGINQSTIENRQISNNDGSISYFLWTSRFFYDDLGKCTGINSIGHNITERKAIEEEKTIIETRLLQSQKMESIGTLAGGIAHDFNNILTPIIGYADLVLLRSPSESVAASIREIRKAADRARELVKQILTFSRLGEQVRQPLQPHLVLKETLQFLRSSVPKTIEIREDIPTDCGMILGDPTNLQQIVMNLCTNAYHAMREKGGVLGVALKQVDIAENDRKVVGLELTVGPYIEIEVSDTGSGMDAHTVEKIFEPYFTTKKKGEGTGLGLSIIHGIVKSHDGHITVYSEPGKGTTFHVYLPRVIGEQLERQEPVQEPLPLGNERLLVVDDEKIITGMLQEILEGLGYQVTVLNKSEEALKLFQERQEDFDLIITDMTMPHLTGLELTKKIFEIRSDMPIILCTGFSEMINKEKAIALGIRYFLMKPVATRDLARAIRNALDKK